jgi:hypothetical protein
MHSMNQCSRGFSVKVRGYEPLMAIVIDPSSISQPVEFPVPSVAEGMLLAGRYRIVDRMFRGWLAYDERLTRSVLLDPILGQGDPAARVRQAASSTGSGMLDAVIFGDEAFAVHTT